MRHQQVVVAAVIERGGRILVSQRGPGAGQAGRWEFPGGKREPGEDDQAALARELREELGVDLEVGPSSGPRAPDRSRCASSGARGRRRSARAPSAASSSAGSAARTCPACPSRRPTRGS